MKLKISNFSFHYSIAILFFMISGLIEQSEKKSTKQMGIYHDAS